MLPGWRAGRYCNINILYYFKDDPDFSDFETPTYDDYEDDEVPVLKMPYIDHAHYINTYDQEIGAHVRVPLGDEISSGKEGCPVQARA
jgi:hypothetical protein